MKAKTTGMTRDFMKDIRALILRGCDVAITDITPKVDGIEFTFEWADRVRGRQETRTIVFETEKGDKK